MSTSSRRNSWIAGLVAAAIACAPLSALAKDPSPQDLETARALFNEGNDLKDKGDLKGALERYLAADELAHTAVTGLEVGKTYLALGKLATAYARFTAVGRIPETDKDSPNVKSARADAALLAKEIESRIPAVTFRIGDDDDTVPTAAFEIDGETRAGAKFGEAIPLDPGVHVIVVRATGHSERKVTIDAKEGEKQVVVLTYAPPKPPKKDPEPTSTVTTRPFDGTKFLVYGGFGLAAAGAVVGTITGIITLSRAPSLRASCEGGRCPPDVHEERASVTRMGNISNFAFILAGCGALAGTIGFLNAPKSAESAPPPPSAVRVTPFIGIGVLGLEGSF